MEIRGIHHVTAVTGNGRANLDFYTRVLGLRLVKKTVNQDMISTYHLFYGDETGSPGTEMTFFDWPDVPRHAPGNGDVATVSFLVPDREALAWWLRRFEEEGVSHGAIEEWTGEPALPFADPEGQRLRLVARGADGSTPWRGSPVPPEVAISGFGDVRLVVERLEPTVDLLTGVFGWTPARTYTYPDNASRQVVVLHSGSEGLGSEVHLEAHPGAPYAQVGVGGVHHVAFRTPNETEHREWQRRIMRAGIPTTPVIDRYYFKSIYFREPGGVLFEIATDGPGFAADEDRAHLGERLSLPPFLEPRRAEIEAALPPLTLDPAATGAGR